MLSHLGSSSSPASPGTPAVVIATRDRKSSLLETLEHLVRLPERPEILVVDNASSDGSPDAVRTDFPMTRVISLSENLGAAARTVGVMQASAETIAFADDDSFWAAGALDQAAHLFAQHPQLGLVAGDVLLGTEQRRDPTCHQMAQSVLPAEATLPGRPILGFIACGAVVRRSAYLETGGFHRRFGVGGEEELLALDLAARGWQLAYVETLTAHHFPSPVRNVARRRRTVTRNALWVAWLRRPIPHVAAHMWRTLREAREDTPTREGLVEAIAGLPWVLRERRRLPPHVEAARRLLDAREPTNAPVVPR